MILTDKETKQFYDLWIPLLDFVNLKYKLIPNLYGVASPKGLPPTAVAQISLKLWENLSAIDEFIESEHKTMSGEEIALVSSWKKMIHGKFIVNRHLKRGSVLISLENEEVYMVKGLYSSWKEILKDFPVPQVVQATLLPFRDVIIHNGIVEPYGVHLSERMAYESNQVYFKAKENKTLHFSL